MAGLTKQQQDEVTRQVTGSAPGLLSKPGISSSDIQNALKIDEAAAGVMPPAPPTPFQQDVSSVAGAAGRGLESGANAAAGAAKSGVKAVAAGIGSVADAANKYFIQPAAPSAPGVNTNISGANVPATPAVPVSQQTVSAAPAPAAPVQSFNEPAARTNTGERTALSQQVDKEWQQGIGDRAAAANAPQQQPGLSAGLLKQITDLADEMARFTPARGMWDKQIKMNALKGLYKTEAGRETEMGKAQLGLEGHKLTRDANMDWREASLAERKAGREAKEEETKLKREQMGIDRTATHLQKFLDAHMVKEKDPSTGAVHPNPTLSYLNMGLSGNVPDELHGPVKKVMDEYEDYHQRGLAKAKKQDSPAARKLSLEAFRKKKQMFSI